MKQVIVTTYFLTMAVCAFAQANGGKNNPLYKFGHTASAPKEIQHYGTSPEFPSLRNLATKEQFVTAMHKPLGKSAKEMNDILMGIGFERGAKDVKLSSVSPEQIDPGTTGNMGDAAHNYVYAKLGGDPNGIRAWKVTGDNGEYVYFIAKCGNAFYPESEVSPASADVTDEPKEAVPEEAPAPVCKNKAYVYYEGVRNMGRRGWDVYANDVETPQCNTAADKTDMAKANDEPAKVYDINVLTTSEYLGYRKTDGNDDDDRIARRAYRREHRMHCGCRR